jgi:hypothetical protein
LGVTRGLLFALIGGVASAVLSIGAFGSAPVLAIGLYLGSAHAGISAGTASLLILLNFNSISTVFYIVATGLPALLIVRQALISQPGAAPNTRDWYPPGQILAWLTAYSILILGCIALYFAISSDVLETVSRDFLQEIFARLMEQSEANFRSDADRTLVKKLLDATADRMAPLLVGFLLATYMLMLIGNATLTQGILNRAGIARRPSPSYAAMVLPAWLSGALAVALIAAFLPGAAGMLGKNAVMVLSIPFLLLGLAVIHTLSRRAPHPGTVLAGLYLALFLFVVMANVPLPAMVLLVLLGIVEQWASLRRRLTGRGANKEDE